MDYDFCVKGSACGDILVRLDSRAKRYIFRCRDGKLYCTAPLTFNEDNMLRSVAKLQPQLEKLMEENPDHDTGFKFSPDTRIDTEYIHFRMEKADVNMARAKWNGDEMVCFYSDNLDWDDEGFHEWLRSGVETWLSNVAKGVFPERLKKMADARGLKYRELKITKAKGRWGSCNTRKNICLSCYLLILPAYLQDYIMQHELTHLLEMNHGARFHALLDEAVGGMDAKYSEEMKRYRP